MGALSRFSLPGGGLVRFHGRMPKKHRRVLRGALLTAAATALTVKGVLNSPTRAIIPTDELQHDLGHLVGAIVPGHPESPAGLPPPPLAGEGGVGAAADTKTPQEAEPSVRSRPHLNAQRLLREAALRHRLDPRLVLAVSYWESGWDQSLVSQTGAVGLMQVEPATAQEAGPALLGRSVDITDAYDNADVGTAVLKEDLDAFHDPTMALAAYYQGPTSLRENGLFPETQQSVQGILDLAARMNP